MLAKKDWQFNFIEIKQETRKPLPAIFPTIAGGFSLSLATIPDCWVGCRAFALQTACCR